MKTVSAGFKYLLLCLVSAGFLLMPAQPVAAQGSGSGCGDRVMGIPAWYNGLTGGDECQIKSPAEVGGLSIFIWTIVLNIIEMMLFAVGYVSTAFIIYGGYKYIISAGSPTGMVSARKTILSAVIGLVLSLVSVAIVNVVANNINGAAG